MSPVVCWLLLCLCVSALLSVVSTVFVANDMWYLDSSDSFECGIDPLGSNHVMFALHFFLVVVVFVVFDAEVLISLPLIVPSMCNTYWFIWITFLLLIFLGLILESLLGTIDWKE